MLDASPHLLAASASPPSTLHAISAVLAFRISLHLPHPHIPRRMMFLDLSTSSIQSARLIFLNLRASHGCPAHPPTSPYVSATCAVSPAPASICRSVSTSHNSSAGPLPLLCLSCSLISARPALLLHVLANSTSAPPAACSLLHACSFSPLPNLSTSRAASAYLAYSISAPPAACLLLHACSLISVPPGLLLYALACSISAPLAAYLYAFLHAFLRPILVNHEKQAGWLAP